MTTRTFQFYGMGYGSETTTITATMDGTVVFNGEVETLPIKPSPTDPKVILYTVDGIPVDFVGSKTMTVTVNSGNLILGDIMANYGASQNTVYTPEQYLLVTTENMTPEQKIQAEAVLTSLAVPPLSDAEVEILRDPSTTTTQFNEVLGAHGLEFLIPTGANGFTDNFAPVDVRSNIILNGVPVPPPARPVGAVGTWHWQIVDGDVFVYDLRIDFGVL